MAQHNDLGRLGEKAVINYLQEHNYSILESNWFFDKYEIDIIAENEEWIVFVEVKTRASDIWGNPEDAISESKIRRIVESAEHYITEKDINKSVRFDVAAVIISNGLTKIDYIEDAFYPPVM